MRKENEAKYFIKGQKFNIFLLIFLIFLTTLAELSFPLVTKFLVDEGILNKNVDLFKYWLIIFGCVGLGSVLLKAIERIQIIKIGTGIMFNMKRRLAYLTNKAKIDFFIKKSAGEIISLLNIEIEKTQYLYCEVIPQTIKTTLLSIGIFLAMVELNKQLAILTLLFVPVVIFNLVYGVKIIQKAQNSILKIYSEKTPFFLRLFSYEGQCQYRSWGILNQKQVLFNDYEYRTNKLVVSRAIRDGLLEALVNKTSLIIIFSMYFFGGRYVIDNELEFGTLIAFTAYMNILLPQLKILASLPTVYAVSKASFDRIYEYINEIPMEKIGREDIDENSSEIIASGLNITKGDKKILDNVNFNFKKGDMVAIIGESGSGKSMIGHLIKGLDKGFNGHLTYSNIDIRNIEHSLLVNNISWVSQVPFLEGGTVRDNVAFGGNYSDDSIKDALKKVMLFEFSENLDYDIGENGNKLSGGQKQRISLARSFLRDTPVVVLDEITSGLDEETSEGILKSLVSIFKNKTVLYITHKSDELKYFNKVLKVDKGTAYVTC